MMISGGRRGSCFDARVPGGDAYQVVVLRSRDDDIVEKIRFKLELMSRCMLLVISVVKAGSLMEATHKLSPVVAMLATACRLCSSLDQ